VASTRLSLQGIEVICFVATCSADDASPVAAQADRQLDPSCKLPASGDRAPQLVIGTLDLNIGEAAGLFQRHPMMRHCTASWPVI